MAADNPERPLAFFGVFDGFAHLGSAYAEAGKRNNALAETAVKAWETEVSRYFEVLSEQSKATLAALADCKGPLDLLAVEQGWFKSRGEAYLEASLRLANAFARVAEPPASESPETLEPARPEARLAPTLVEPPSAAPTAERGEDGQVLTGRGKGSLAPDASAQPAST